MQNSDFLDVRRAYSDLTNHRSVNHNMVERMRGMIHTNRIESFWLMMHRRYERAFYHMPEEHLHHYVNEFAGRHNIRNMDTIDMTSAISENITSSELTYRKLISHV